MYHSIFIQARWLTNLPDICQLKGGLGISLKTRKIKTTTEILFLTIIIAAILLLGRTLIPFTNVLAEIIDGTRGNDVISGSKVSITAVNGNETS